MKRILLVKTSSMGDVIHNCPVVADLLKHYPNVVIDWLVEESFADIPKLHPKVNQVFTCAVRRWRRQLLNGKTWQEIRQLKDHLASQPYDVVIDTQGLIKSAVMARWVTGVKHGYDRNSIREPFASHFYQQRHTVMYQQHAVNRNRALVALSLGYPIPDDAPDYGLSITSIEIDSSITANLAQPYVMFLHGTSRDSKLWPTEYWIKLGHALEKQGLTLVLPWSNAAELTRAKLIQTALNQAIVLPKLSIVALAGIVGKAKAVVGVDTGLSHLATALNIPTIAIYTDSNPKLTGVYAGSISPAINLGGKAQMPNVTDVLEKLELILT